MINHFCLRFYLILTSQSLIERINGSISSYWHKSGKAWLQNRKDIFVRVIIPIGPAVNDYPHVIGDVNRNRFRIGRGCFFCFGPLENKIFALDVLVFQAGNVFGFDSVTQVREQPSSPAGEVQVDSFTFLRSCFSFKPFLGLQIS